jgi:hypothetical protein
MFAISTSILTGIYGVVNATIKRSTKNSFENKSNKSYSITSGCINLIRGYRSKILNFKANIDGLYTSKSLKKEGVGFPALVSLASTIVIVIRPVTCCTPAGLICC